MMATKLWIGDKMFLVDEEVQDEIERQAKRIAELEVIRDAATNLVRAEGWQIERDNLWDTLHDLIDAEDAALQEDV